MTEVEPPVVGDLVEAPGQQRAGDGGVAGRALELQERVLWRHCSLGELDAPELRRLKFVRKAMQP